MHFVYYFVNEIKKEVKSDKICRQVHIAQISSITINYTHELNFCDHSGNRKLDRIDRAFNRTDYQQISEIYSLHTKDLST